MKTIDDKLFDYLKEEYRILNEKYEESEKKRIYYEKECHEMNINEGEIVRKLCEVGMEYNRIENCVDELINRYRSLV